MSAPLALLLAVRALAGETAIVTRIPCDAEEAQDEARAPRERVVDYRRYQEVLFARSREVRCYPGGDYAPEPWLESARTRLGRALERAGAPATAPTRWLARWQRPPEEGVSPLDVTRTQLDLEGCLTPETDPRPACRLRARVWYFRAGMRRESPLLELVIDATRAAGFDPARHPFQELLALDRVDAARPSVDLSSLFD